MVIEESEEIIPPVQGRTRTSLSQSAHSESLVPPEVEVAHSTAGAVEPKSVKEVEVTEEAPAVDSVWGITPDVATEEKPTVGEPEVPVPEPRKEVEEHAPAEEPGPSPEITEHELPAPAASEPTVEPVTEEEPTSGVSEPELPTHELAVGDVPLAESESVIEPQETGAVPPPVPSEEKSSAVETKLEEATPVISEPAEASLDVPTSDIPQQGSNEVERPRSPWTPSYSVSSQGGGLDNLAPADEEVIGSTTAPELPVEEQAAESAPMPEIVNTAEVRTINCLARSPKIDRFSSRSHPLPNQRANLSWLQLSQPRRSQNPL